MTGLPSDDAAGIAALAYGSDAPAFRSPCSLGLRDEYLGIDYASKGFVGGLEVDAAAIRVTLRPLPGWLALAPVDPVDPSEAGLEDAYVLPHQKVRLVARLKSGGVRIVHKVIGYPEYVAVTAAVDGATLLGEFSRLGYPTQDLGLTPLAWRAVMIASIAGIGVSLAVGILLKLGTLLLIAGLLVPVMVFAYSRTR